MLKKLLHITCLKATYLSSKKEEGKTTFKENVQLKIHHTICDSCKFFAKQTSYIGTNAKHGQQYISASLSQASLHKMKKMLAS